MTKACFTPAVATDALLADCNHFCQCKNVDIDSVYSQLATLNMPILNHRSFFVSAATYLSELQVTQMAGVIQAIESIIQLPAYQTQILATAPASAQFALGPHSVFMGYDFHLTPQGPQLIEINTNAGGAMLNVLLAKYQKLCCANVSPFVTTELETQFVEMFQQEWRLQRGKQSLTTIAIVDDKPTQQFLYPEFMLFKQLFESHGIQTIIASPSEFHLADGKVKYGDLVIDLIYNRLTDFYFEQPQHAVLLQAYAEQAAVMTPTPRAHALYAHKQNLALLTDAAQLRAWHVDEQTIQTLSIGIPHTFIVNPAQAEQLWQQRRALFFKPVAGYGSKGTYRGDKLTRRVFNDIILTGNYVAQAYTPASERYLDVAGKLQAFKIDIRCYVYQGQLQLIAARLYQGQTTNFRTPGGGFSPIAIYRSLS